MPINLPRRAEELGLHYVEVGELCIRRRRRGRGFSYVDADGRPVRDPVVLARIRALVLPPAWTEVCIAEDPFAHIQAIGRDAEGRHQYRYHEEWTTLRNRVKAERLVRFGRALPRIRDRLERDLRRRTPDRIYAAAVAGRLVDRALLRSGHNKNGIEDGGRGATTLLKSDVKLNGTKVHLAFTGKSGKRIDKTVRDPILLDRLRRLKAIGRKRLFAFKDEHGRCCYLSARDLNTYLREAGHSDVTAKDFRTFAASAQAIAELARAERPESERARRRIVAAVMRSVSERLANTPAVARASYVHPLVVEAYEAGAIGPELMKGPLRRGLTREETALMRFLESRPSDERRPSRRAGPSAPARQAARPTGEPAAEAARL
ncbi:DNA topoisomerase IB [Propylenella binzhouense]|uniref:DNA topoisomerase n=1 Tax=Propylenella binzhouense TaxID=2555902 RepID=A0A964WT99_9HYPH|nr:DNA topoisomerase IB [Propylenella binzhouense]MYZ47778.1 DNA topoisomerase IB [Propylenella binzhouense]